MNQITLLFASSYGAMAVIFGAFGAHALKKVLTEELLKSFETGVKYQMYHAILLLALSFQLDFSSSLDNYIAYTFIIGIFLFSFSIYGLVLSSAKGNKIKILGPITPLGGLFLVAGWSLLIYKAINL
jgi:uncharacterized membrane protein YgdD (TMEM256/DUF423 family)